jgi:hypothetical protein
MRHQLLAPRRVLDDARVSQTPLAPMVARAVAEMRQRRGEVVTFWTDTSRGYPA